MQEATSIRFFWKFLSSYTERSTNNEQAEHFCHAVPKTDMTIFIIVWSRSPEAVRIMTFFPPVSAASGVAGIAFAMLRAVSGPPVKIICFTLQSQKHRRAEHNGTIAMQSLQCLLWKPIQKKMSVHTNIFKEMCICKCIDISPIINHLFDVFPEVWNYIPFLIPDLINHAFTG